MTTDNQLVPITWEGAAGEAIALDFAPTDMAAVSGSSVGNGRGEIVVLVAPGSDVLSIDPGVGELLTAPGVRGARIALGAGAAWVSTDGTIIKVQPGEATPVRYTFETHRADDPVLVIGNALWVADPAGIVRMNLANGERSPRIPGPASALVAAGGLVWAAQGTSLVGLDADNGTVVRTASLPSSASIIVALATHGDIVWLATEAGPDGPLLVGVDPATGRTVSLTPLSTTPVSIAVVGNQVWTLDAAGHTGRFEPG